MAIAVCHGARTLPLAIQNLTLLTHRQLEADERTAVEQVRDQFRLAARD